MPGPISQPTHKNIHVDVQAQIRQLWQAIRGATGDPERVNRVTSAGTAQTIPDVTVATISYLTLTATSCAVTLPTAAAGKSLTVVLEQDASGGRLATWVNPSGSVKWAGGGAAPVLTVAGSQADVFTFLCYDGANYAAFIAGQNI